MKRKILSLVLSYSVLMGASLVYNDYKMQELDNMEVDVDEVVKCGVCANIFEQSEIDEHDMCSKCRCYYKQCELCGYYATDKEENFNDGICIVCLNPSLLEE